LTSKVTGIPERDSGKLFSGQNQFHKARTVGHRSTRPSLQAESA
jgi:hypothetical protein